MLPWQITEIKMTKTETTTKNTLIKKEKGKKIIKLKLKI